MTRKEPPARIPTPEEDALIEAAMANDPDTWEGLLDDSRILTEEETRKHFGLSPAARTNDPRQ